MRIASLLRALGVFLILSTLAVPSSSSEINTCKYLLVTDFTSDPYGIALELRKQAAVRGFTVVAAATEITQTDSFKTCVMAGSWSSNATGEQVSVRVVAAEGGELMGEAAAGGTAWWSVHRTVRAVVGKLYDQLGYTGFDSSIPTANGAGVSTPTKVDDYRRPNQKERTKEPHRGNME